MRVKICGITNIADAKFVESCGADAVGVVISDESKRNITCEKAKEIFDALGPFIAKVVVTHTDSEEKLKEIAAINPTAIQISSQVKIPNDYHGRVIRVIKPNMPIPTDCNAVIIDESRGNGIFCNVMAAAEIVKNSKLPVIVSGGLTPFNVAGVINAVEPYAVDVCSGVEKCPGQKDRLAILEFLKACGKAPQLKVKKNVFTK